MLTAKINLGEKPIIEAILRLGEKKASGVF